MDSSGLNQRILPWISWGQRVTGCYDVTVGVGRPGRAYANDPHNLTVEGRVVVDDEPTTEAQTTIVRTVRVELTDGSLSVEMGGRSASTDDFAYTFVSYIDVIAVE